MTEPKTSIDRQPMMKIYRSLPQLLMANFLSGVAWGLGSVIGATLVVAIIGMLIARSSQIPLLGKLVEITMVEIQQAQQEAQFSTD